MTIKCRTDVKAAFERGGVQAKAEPAAAPEVPERIRTHAPQPALRPGGSWKARADAHDRALREAQEAEKAKSRWAARMKATPQRKLSRTFGRSA